MKSFWPKLLVFLVPAAAAALFLLWWFNPTQVLLRQVDALFESIEHRGVSLGGTPRENGDRLESMLAPEFEVTAPDPVPSGPIPPKMANRLLQEFQYSVSNCRITREEATVAFPQDGEAIVQTTIEVDVSGGGARRILRYQCRMEYRREEKNWLLRAMVLTPL